MDIINENGSFFRCCKCVVGLLWHSSIWNFLMKKKEKNQAHEELLWSGKTAIYMTGIESPVYETKGLTYPLEDEYSLVIPLPNSRCLMVGVEVRNVTYSPEKWLHNWIATGPNKSKKLTRLTSPAHTTHGKVRINPLEIWVVMQRASKQRSSQCDHGNSGPVVRFSEWTQLSV